MPLSWADVSVARPAWGQDDLVAALLLLLLGVALGIGLVCLLVVLHFLKTGRMTNQNVPMRPDRGARDRRPAPTPGTLPSRWLAVRSRNPMAVQAALGLRKATPCSWEEGLSAAHEHKLFISPPINGWTLVLGSSLPDPSEDVDRAFHFLLTLSAKLGQVQFFSLNRPLHHHAWVRADLGQVQRAYAWAGKTLWNQGRPTASEVELGLKCFDYEEMPLREDFTESDPAALNTERVPMLAARWSLDPSGIDPRVLRESQGISGRFSRSNTP